VGGPVDWVKYIDREKRVLMLEIGKQLFHEVRDKIIIGWDRSTSSGSGTFSCFDVINSFQSQLYASQVLEQLQPPTRAADSMAGR
jgi:hypothetical protein